MEYSLLDSKDDQIIDPQYQRYYCSNCKQIPQLTLQDDYTLQVQCNCYSKKETLSVEESKKLSLEELSQYKAFNLDLPTYLELTKKNIEVTLTDMMCEGKKCKSNGISQFYCTQCKAHICQKCK